MSLPSTYSAFLNTVQHYKVGDVDELISHSSKLGVWLNQFFNSLMPACYILDYTQGKYVYASPRMRHFIGHPASRILDGGVEFGISLWNKPDLKIYSEKVFSENLKFLKQTPVIEHSDFLFHCNYRLNAKGGYKNVVQESVFVKSSESKMPLATIGFLYDVSNYTNSTIINHRIIHLNDNTVSKNYGTSVLENTYFANEHDGLLTKREIEILKCVCGDLSSDQIADRLFISKHTVDNHRRNLLRKTNIKTSIGLVRYAIEQGLV